MLLFSDWFSIYNLQAFYNLIFEKPYDFSEGAMIPIDKPITWSSFDVVNKIRRTIKVKKVGHAGTLDPLATGLLILCTGKYTKKIGSYQNDEKEYVGIFGLGKTTPSFDLETAFNSNKSFDHINEKEVINASEKFLGTIKQVPPVFSAIKINGRASYKNAREKKDIKLQPREVSIHEFQIENYVEGEVFFRIVCSKGTYIRSIANDIGQELGVGAFLKELRRTRIGEITVNDALSVDRFLSWYNAQAR